MAFIDPERTVRVPVPHETDEWVEVRRSTVRDMRDLQRDHADKTSIDRSVMLLSWCIKAWSYDKPISVDSIESMDSLTFMWLERQLDLARPAEEKKDLAISSSPSSDPATVSTPESSLT